MYWDLNVDLLSSQYDIEIEQTISTTGDSCHYVIHGLSDNRAKKFYKRQWLPENIYFCVDNEIISGDMDRLEAEIYES